MPHLYLPSDHTDADLALAADVASAVASSDLYVTWTLAAGAGVPEVEALLRDESVPERRGPLTALAHGIARLWRHLMLPPAQDTAPQRQPRDAARPTGEPSR